MSIQDADTRSFDSERRPLSRSLTEALLRRMLRRLDCGQLVVDTPAGERLVFDGDRPGLQARLTIHSWRCLWRLATGGDIGFAEAYRAGEWSSPNLAAMLKFACHNKAATEPLRSLHVPRFCLKLRHALNRNTLRGSRRNIAVHYDLGNKFYKQWLDAGMTYSSGLFSSADQTLEEAQDAKLDRVVDMLGLAGGETVLEIGCGWGGLAERVLDRHDCAVTGVTLSAEQLAFAQRRLRNHTQSGRCDLRLQDYRNVRGAFDRIVSIEMLEAVGEAYWSTYFEKLRDSLRLGGAAVLQVITINEDRFENYRRRPDFIQKYIFPGGMLPTTQIIEREIAKAGLRLVANEFFGESYARTLEEWRLRFQSAWTAIEGLGFDECFKRTWEYYLAYCEVGFEVGALNVGLYKVKQAGSRRKYK
jgi:cyclopropane-fatty-acyl-phospholipid synthase